MDRNLELFMCQIFCQDVTCCLISHQNIYKSLPDTLISLTRCAVCLLARAVLFVMQWVANKFGDCCKSQVHFLPVITAAPSVLIPTRFQCSITFQSESSSQMLSADRLLNDPLVYIYIWQFFGLYDPKDCFKYLRLSNHCKIAIYGINHTLLQIIRNYAWKIKLPLKAAPFTARPFNFLELTKTWHGSLLLIT